MHLLISPAQKQIQYSSKLINSEKKTHNMSKPAIIYTQIRMYLIQFY